MCVLNKGVVSSSLPGPNQMLVIKVQSVLTTRSASLYSYEGLPRNIHINIARYFLPQTCEMDFTATRIPCTLFYQLFAPEHKDLFGAAI